MDPAQVYLRPLILSVVPKPPPQLTDKRLQPLPTCLHLSCRHIDYQMFAYLTNRKTALPRLNRGLSAQAEVRYQ